MRVLVIGAGGAVGEAIAHALAAEGCDVIAAMRGDHPAAAARLRGAGAEVRRLDLDGDLKGAFANLSGAVLTPILTTSIRAVPAIAEAGLASVVFFSSNNVAADLGDPVYASLRDAEQKLRATLPHATILRPTLIYGDPRLLTLPRLVRFMRLSPILPIPGNAGTLQQPVHYEDLARVAAVAVRDEALRCKTFAVGGPDIVTKKEMYMLLSRLAGGTRIPAPAPQTLLNLLRAIAPLPLDPAQIARLNVDRIAVPVDSLPAALAPSVRLDEGFRRLIAAMRQDEQPWRAGPDPA